MEKFKKAKFDFLAIIVLAIGSIGIPNYWAWLLILIACIFVIWRCYRAYAEG